MDKKKISSTNVKGMLAGILGAIAFGFIPMFSKPAVALHLSASCILTYRFGLATLLLLGFLLVQREKVAISWHVLPSVLVVTIFSCLSAGLLLDGYNYMGGGVSGVIHFTYPIWVMVILVIFYRERIKISAVIAILIALAGMYCLGVLGSHDSFVPGANKLLGIIIVIASGVACASYMVIINKTACKDLSAMALTFWLLFFSTICFGAVATTNGTMQMVYDSSIWIDFIGLALIATVASNFLLIYSVKTIGSTYAAILGAVEPVTAVVTCAILFHERLTIPIIIGIILILGAVTIIVVKGEND